MYETQFHNLAEKMGIPGSFCSVCNKAIVPPRDICPYCGLGASEMAKIDLSPEGTVLSYTLLNRPPSGFQPPVLLALVKLERDAMLLCLGDKDLLEKIEIGAPVKVFTDNSKRFQFTITKRR